MHCIHGNKWFISRRWWRSTSGTNREQFFFAGLSAHLAHPISSFLLYSLSFSVCGFFLLRNIWLCNAHFNPFEQQIDGQNALHMTVLDGDDNDNDSNDDDDDGSKWTSQPNQPTNHPTNKWTNELMHEWMKEWMKQERDWETVACNQNKFSCIKICVHIVIICFPQCVSRMYTHTRGDDHAAEPHTWCRQVWFKGMERRLE